MCHALTTGACTTTRRCLHSGHVRTLATYWYRSLFLSFVDFRKIKFILSFHLKLEFYRCGQFCDEEMRHRYESALSRGDCSLAKENEKWPYSPSKGQDIQLPFSVREEFFFLLKEKNSKMEFKVHHSRRLGKTFRILSPTLQLLKILSWKCVHWHRTLFTRYCLGESQAQRTCSQLF